MNHRRMPGERAIRAYWVAQLWSRKGFDSPDEFLEIGNCFACGFSWKGDCQPPGTTFKAQSSAPCAGLSLLCRKGVNVYSEYIAARKEAS